MESSVAGRVECIRLLLEKNADVQLRNKNGETGLTLGEGHLDCLQLMIEAKAEVNQQNYNDLHVALTLKELPRQGFLDFIYRRQRLVTAV
jgi:ankyrin repeat protein